MQGSDRQRLRCELCACLLERIKATLANFLSSLPTESFSPDDIGTTSQDAYRQ